MKRTQINRKANIKLEALYKEKWITSCEIREVNCMGELGLSWHHRHKRVWYYDKPDSMLSEFNQTLLVCLLCHKVVEYSKWRHEYWFRRLRDEEEL